MLYCYTSFQRVGADTSNKTALKKYLITNAILNAMLFRFLLDKKITFLHCFKKKFFVFVTSDVSDIYQF